MLEPLIGHERTLARDPPADSTPSAIATVRDLGQRYAIEVSAVVSEQTDTARDCVERARVAAVFIAMNVRTPPPAHARDETPARREPAPSPVPAAPTAPSWQLALGAFASLAYAPSAQLAGGGGLELWLTRAHLQLGLTSGALSASQLAIDPGTGHVDLLRLPTNVLAGAMWRISRFELGAALGLALDLLRAQGRALARSESGWRANVGGVLALQSRLLLTHRWSLSALVNGSFFPRSYQLQVAPAARSADTPRFWLAAQLGVLFRLR